MDVPELPGLFPAGWAQSGLTAYVRLHSRDAGKWYQSGQDRYDYDYTDAELGTWIDELTRRDAGGELDRALFLFNNCQRSQAAVNASRMRALLGTEARQVNLVAPPAPVAPRQATLFG